MNVNMWTYADLAVKCRWLYPNVKRPHHIYIKIYMCTRRTTRE